MIEFLPSIRELGISSRFFLLIVIGNSRLLARTPRSSNRAPTMMVKVLVLEVSNAIVYIVSYELSTPL